MPLSNDEQRQLEEIERHYNEHHPFQVYKEHNTYPWPDLSRLSPQRISVMTAIVIIIFGVIQLAFLTT